MFACQVDLHEYNWCTIIVSDIDSENAPSWKGINPMKEKNPNAVALGRRGGLKGGPSRAAKLSPAERSTIARAAADARWYGPGTLAGEHLEDMERLAANSR